MHPLTILEVAKDASPTLMQVFTSEVFGTGLLVLLGTGVVANVLLKKTKGNGPDWLMISFGWGIAVFVGVLAASLSGAHLNPAVTIGLLASGAKEYAPGVDVTTASTITYLAAELTGGILGAIVSWLAHKQHFDAEPEAALKLGVFSTAPEIRSYGWNLITEVIATFVLVFSILSVNFISGNDGAWPSALGPLPVALVVVGIGASLGGPTGYAINPARDLGPRIAHAILPIKGKGSSDWAYSWVPIVGPLLGGSIAGVTAMSLY